MGPPVPRAARVSEEPLQGSTTETGGLGKHSRLAHLPCAAIATPSKLNHLGFTPHLGAHQAAVHPPLPHRRCVKEQQRKWRTSLVQLVQSMLIAALIGGACPALLHCVDASWCLGCYPVHAKLPQQTIEVACVCILTQPLPETVQAVAALLRSRPLLLPSTSHQACSSR